MTTRILQRFVRDEQAAFVIMTALLMPLFMTFIFVSYEIGRFYLASRALSSATQQTVEWMANRGSAPTENPDALTLDALKQRLAKTMFTRGDLTTTFAYDQTTNISRLTANYTFTFNTGGLIAPVTAPITTDARIKLKPVFFSIVFSSGEMRSEGNSIYGEGQDGTLASNRGVSWSNTYYTGVINQPVPTRTTPTNNYYMVNALVKELASRFAYRKKYFNIIPVSATINLNPTDYSSNYSTTDPLNPRKMPGTREGKLPPWIYADTGFTFDNTSNAVSNSAYCITNRSFPSQTATYAYQQNYYRITASELGTSLPIHAHNTFTHDQLLMDSTLTFQIEDTQSTSTNVNALKPRGYPYSPLNNGRCPAINTTPALATFHEVTTNDYTPDTTSKVSVTENENFWDYMRTYIDPTKVKDYYIWGSPNISFGLQIAYENIADVQKFKRINNSSAIFDPASDFFVYVVSDQIGGVKNAGGAHYVQNPNDTNRWANRNQCIGKDYVSYNVCNTNQLGILSQTPARQLPANNTANATSVNFQFTHFWWDNAYNPAGPACFGYSIDMPQSCDIVYSAHPQQVVHNFYNIINYSIDLKFNKSNTLKFKRPRAFFVDPGTGKRPDECQASNANQKTVRMFTNRNNFTFVSTINPALHYTAPKPCTAYAEMSGYKTLYSSWGNVFLSNPATEIYEGAILNIGMRATITPGNSFQGMPEYNDWFSLSGLKSQATGFDQIYAWEVGTFPSGSPYSLPTLSPAVLPLTYLPIQYLFHVRSNSKDNTQYAVFDKTANAAGAAKFIVQDMLTVVPVAKPY